VLIDVTVKVDDTRVADLYAAIISEDLTIPRVEPQPEPTPPLKPEPVTKQGTKSGALHWRAADRRLAASIWQRIQPDTQKVFSVLLRAPGKKFTSDELISLTNAPGGRAFAATLTWPGNYCRDAGRSQFWQYANRQYWIEPAVAAIFARASSEADNL
jgi:hypothetical protein